MIYILIHNSRMDPLLSEMMYVWQVPHTGEIFLACENSTTVTVKFYSPSNFYLGDD